MIQINNVTKKFDTVVALNDLSCTINKGSVFGLVGSNGSGKSTLLRIISGVFKADEGKVLIDEESSYENETIKSRCSFISDYPYFFNDSTIENLAWFYRQIYPNWNEEKYERLSTVFPLNKKARIITMSKGMQRQAAILLSLSTMPDFLFLDEIFDGLDPVIRQLVKKLIMEEVASRKMTVIIASHNLRELEDTCDHVGLLHKGGIILEQELDELKLGIHKVQIAFSSEQEAPFKDLNLNIVSKEKRGSLYSIVIKGNKDEFSPVLYAKNPVFIESLPLTLEEVFISEMEGAGYDIDKIL